MKDRSGKIITTEREQESRLVEHFPSMLNRPDPTTEFSGATQKEQLHIITDTPSKAELTKAIQVMNTGKTAGVDGIQTELLKMDIVTSTDVCLHCLFNSI